ncbi:cation efflux system protein czcD [Magnaporthiopsis poae ATCC 64411]|uniref:Cation efflux system protein czcD n=1 Tax=Magnaporthiopsis poae (strain ATCC 64411 / 73-15) TaxID=644358 RepID=A0A0C4DMK3_MAGP6|nr:cation efflux system protein czcD [Magnaporthiopsis poae ATCC 64411]
MALSISRKQRLTAAVIISSIFFVVELLVVFETRSLALLADSFHYINDIIGFVVALSAIHLSERTRVPRRLSFGWQRASLLGAFFNGVFLLALGLSIFLQSIERFVSLQTVQNAEHVFIMGCVGLGLNILCVLVLHESHRHDVSGDRAHSEDDAEAMGSGQTRRLTNDGVCTPLTIRSEAAPHANHRHNLASASPQPASRDLGMLGVMLHVAGDALNNLGVTVAALVIWKTESPVRYYADPSVGVFIAVVILVTAVPLVRKSGEILLQSTPPDVNPDDVVHDLEKIPGVQSVRELRIWRLDQRETVASLHLSVEDEALCMFMEKAKTASECLHAYGIHTSTIQPEVLPCMATELPAPSGSGTSGSSSILAGSTDHERARNACQLQCRGCQLGPGSVCCR